MRRIFTIAALLTVMFGILRVNAQDSLNISTITRIDYWDFTYETVIEGNYAYMSSWDTGLRIIDISNFPVMVEVSSLAGENEYRNLVKSGNYVYITERDFPDRSIIHIIDVSDPVRPVEISFIDFPDWGINDMDIENNYLYVAMQDDKLNIINVSNPYQPFIAGSYSTEYAVQSVAVSGDIACIGVQTNKFYTLNIENPANPIFLGFNYFVGTPYDIDIQGDYAYCASYDFGLWSMDISDPQNPIALMLYGSTGTIGVEAIGNMIYIANDYGLEILDFHNPFQPVLAGGFQLPGGARMVSIVRNFAFMSCSFNGLQVIDVSRPSNCRRAGFINLCGSAVDVAVNGDYAYSANYENGMFVYDISDPANPLIISQINVDGSAQEIAVAENYAYLAADEAGVVIFDISNPAELVSHHSNNDM